MVGRQAKRIGQRELCVQLSLIEGDCALRRRERRCRKARYAFTGCAAVDLRLRCERVPSGETGQHLWVAVGAGFDRAAVRLDRARVRLRIPFGEAGVAFGDARRDQRRVTADAQQSRDALPLRAHQCKHAHNHDQHEPTQR